jgi:hypothetical protein
MVELFLRLARPMAAELAAPMLLSLNADKRENGRQVARRNLALASRGVR